jgi:hypothetical protein
MKTTLLRVTVTLAMVVAFASVSAFGQSVSKRQSFVIPFAFKVGHKVLPAGKYSVSSESQTVRIQSKDGKRSIDALPFRAGSTNPNDQVKLLFRRNGDDYQLYQVWLADGVGRQFKQQRDNSSLSEIISVVSVSSGN